MRQYQPASIRYHRPTQSAVETKQNICFSQFASDSLEKSVQMGKREESMGFGRFDSISLGQNQNLQMQYQTLMQKIQDSLSQKNFFTKHQRIRIKEWISKLSWKQSNPVWKKNVNFYLKVLSQMIKKGQLSKPFNNLPEEGPLRKLSIYDLPFPLRDKFSSSKDRSKSKKSMDHNWSQIFNSKEKLVNQISSIKGYDFSQSCVLDGNKAKSTVQRAKIKDKILVNEQFKQNEINMAMAMKPVFSNHKKRKENIQKSNPNSSKISNSKGNHKNQTQRIMKNINNDESNKQNDPYSVNINRKLFKSKEKGSEQLAFRTQYFIKSDYSFSRQESNPNSWFSNGSDSERNSQIQHQKRDIFPKIYKLLRQNEQALSNKPQYSCLVEEIKNLGRKMNIPQFSCPSLDDSTLSQNSKAFLRQSEQIKYKFEETDNQTVRFMHFLNDIKSKQVSKSQKEINTRRF